jgi:hypothetical protein
MARLCYISRAYRDIGSAGNKAKTDYEDILVSMGATNLGLKRTIGNGKISSFLRNLCGIMAFTIRLRKGDIVVLQYPVKKYFRFLCRIARLRKASTIAFIHDLSSCRRHKITLRTELKRLNSATHIIAANPAMEQWLVQQGLTASHSSLGFHDYLSPAHPHPSTHTKPWELCYAGSLNMRKNSFLLAMCELAAPIDMHLYGYMADYTPSQGKTISIIEHGYTSPQDFITSAKGDFGLVWDGDSLDSCSGSWGEYLRLNTPHKCSFYIRAGLPLIVWNQSAVAQLVKETGTGIVIESLRKLPEILESISENDYRLMRENIASLAQQLANGHSMRHAVTHALNTVNA